jgi:hypothetical protein
MTSTALTVAREMQAVDYADALRPRSLDQAMTLAEQLAKSDFVPGSYKNKPGNIIAAVQMGAELGFAPMQALQTIAVINGKPAVYGDGILALIQSHPAYEWHKEWFEGEGDNYTAICQIKRRGSPAPAESRFSVADAKRAHLWGKQGPWTQYPDRMQQMRARGFCARDSFADALKGLISEEEARDYPTRAEVLDVSPPQAAAPKTAAPKGPPAQKQSAVDRVKGKVADKQSVTAAPKTAAPRTEPPKAAPPAEDAAMALEEVIARIEMAETEEQLKQLADAAMALPEADQGAAREAYKARAREIREALWRARRVQQDQAAEEPPHDPGTGEIIDERTGPRQPGEDG